MTDFSKKCFVCGKDIDPENTNKNEQFNLPICNDCIGTDREKAAIAELLDGMGESGGCSWD